ncbi:hypothetical protein GH714_011991 [Hevea brasiliensis]|uniref:Bulb-type lectin domain-containing protein n=1 Tax=Hevea brasiliensis TaxID=3981 RepID=A0A6A6LNE5_HEVBR|nr:hypothetical protein GH714_011991 [Hevea brasiliensis]
MAIWTTLKAVMQFLIILFLAFFVAAQTPTAQVSTPTSWTNNISLPSVSYSRIILSDGNASAALFENKTISSESMVRGSVCAFYPVDYLKDDQFDPDSARFFLVVALLETSGYNFPDLSNYGLSNIWSANRNKPVRENATLQLLVDGNLELRDADGSLVWSTNTSNKSVAGMKMMDTGNLVLHDTNNNIVWQSFDHPTDTLVPGQKLVRGQKLVSSVSEYNISEGNFYLSVTSHGLLGFYQANVPQMYLKFFDHVWNLESIELKYSGSEDIALYVNAPEFGALGSPWLSASVSVRSRPGLFLKFESNGHLILHDGSMTVAHNMLTSHIPECDYPTICNDYEFCSNGMCLCPPGLAQGEPELAQGESESGCPAINATTCENLEYHSLLTYQNVYHFSYIDDGAAALKGTDIESCKKECLKNCSCKVALFRHDYNSLLGDCFLPSPVLTLIYDEYRRRYYKSSYAFIKTLNKKENGRGSSRSKIVAGSTIGAFFLVGLAIGFWSQPEECMHLLPIFMRKAEEDQLVDMVDRSNQDMQFHHSEAVQMMKVAIWCLQSDYKRRPSMSDVVKALEGNLDVEAYLDYTIHNPIKVAAARREAEQGTATPILPSLLSGPR